ncbi:MAG TPA: Gfo/Idh/MocA family oxidoreductase [Ktedonobacteraceae bacterium]|nr:Gfo/Idh/MocA family oxidoreductase [Ktedonobacteraceae bacterium]
MSTNWGVIGAGFIANRAVIPAIQAVSDARVLAVASLDEQRAQAAADRFAIPRVYHDYAELLDDLDVQIVYIALPNHLHREWTIRAAQHGKHVLCEKPLALNAAECDEMIHACRQAGVLLMEAAMYRFHPRMQALKAMLDAGEAGDLRFLHSAFSFPFNAPGNYRAFPIFGGGALLDIGSYCINAARWLTGSEPTSAQAAISYSRSGIDLSASAILQFGDQAAGGNPFSAHIQCSFAAAEHQVIEVVGSRAAITAPLAFTAWREDATALLIQRDSLFEEWNFPSADPYRLMVEHFTDCVLGRSELLFPPEDGRATMRVIDMLKRSE